MAKPRPSTKKRPEVVIESTKKRVDQWLVELGIAPTREKAQALIMAGQVLAGTRRIDKAGQSLNPVEAHTLNLKEGSALKYVSRGGFKLEHALDVFQIDPTGKLALDVGASTGGFSDCFLQHGARKVIALDVGNSQLAWSLRQDSRVYILDHTNVRYSESLPEVEPGRGAALADVAAVDVSFISLKLVLPAVRNLIIPDAPLVVLVKPQFEAGKERVGKGGIIKDTLVHRAVLEDLIEWWNTNRFTLQGLIRSPILGTEGNLEFLAHLKAVEEVVDNWVTPAAHGLEQLLGRMEL
ncbi:TlyA family RNA methyltransferase [Candidatus Chlorohelix allophototropha]|uniref:TlyA family RNA methyltransferase n=1 Tax=Candidatus Chlorohelix allophototropha TaxID=3003348 RepID=A0ABY9B7Y9_9CHLR|nr:TlyA family RNA methyltransferase [Chloroflexota bacterium L227-S17]